MTAVRFFLFFSLLITISFPSLCFSQSDVDTLIKLKQSFLQGDLNSWIPAPGSSPCLQKWVGVICSGESIVGLHLTNLHLSGTVDVLPLLQLRDLRSISLMSNSFTGPIPDFNKLGALKSLYLSRNQFSGDIPSGYFSSMRSLKKVWLNENQFTGRIPESLMQLPHLLELHLDGNQFDGTIPPLKTSNVLRSLNLTRNNLQGRIPESFYNFSAASFEENVGLCGKPLPKDCQGAPPPVPSPSSKFLKENRIHGKAMLAATTLFIVLCFVVASMVSTQRRKKEELSIPRGRRRDELLPTHLPPESFHRLSVDSSGRGRSGSKRDSTASQPTIKNAMADLVMVNDEKGKLGLQDLMKAAAEVLGSSGVLGSAYKAVLSNGLAVVVKRMRGINRLDKDEFDAEMRRFGKLKHPNVLTPLAYHFRREEKLIVSEHMPKGSLSYVLHGTRDVVHANLNWPTRLKIIKGIARGLSYIHTEYATYEVPHGNLKSSNVLLSNNYDPLLNDYAFEPLINVTNVAQALFAYKSPEYLQYRQVSPKSDIYCLGIIIMEIMTGKFPSQYLSHGEGGIDIVQWVQLSILQNQAEELIDPEIANNAGSVDQKLQVLKIGAACAESNPHKRLDMNEIINRIEEVS
ncbi:pollen receptor-like kinase 3 [Gossypium arboreum]|uniref:Protein kinase domain-containing protein n=1 Tax=Gossypium arboreum TaxID=29729 RepID=A0ABR0PSN5_GOSAR|nr:pollen receptor-like kinase 3 [Gossypium arboreum]KAK5829995.1 hypothetical protein PVK06_013789 [Gossypium arboreum]